MLNVTPVTIFVILVLFGGGCSRDPLARAPRLILVTPDRAEDLRFLNSANAGVALLSGKIVFSVRGAELVPRQSAFYLPQGKPFLIAVFDVQSPATKPTNQQMEEAAHLIARRTAEHFFAAVQINWHVSGEQRSWFRDLLAHLRPVLQTHQLLVAAVDTNTCADRDWVQSVAADAVVPLDGVCGATSRLKMAPGTRSDLVIRPRTKRIYLESTEPWTPVAIDEIAALINRH